MGCSRKRVRAKEEKDRDGDRVHGEGGGGGVHYSHHSEGGMVDMQGGGLKKCSQVSYNVRHPAKEQLRVDAFIANN